MRKIVCYECNYLILNNNMFLKKMNYKIYQLNTQSLVSH